MTEARSDSELVRAFVETRSEAAFAELVERHVNLVYSAALRHLRGDAHLARDATQAVFCELARSALSLCGRPTLSGWLYTTTRFIALRMGRSESRRAAREQAFVMRNTEPSLPEVTWKEVENLLDEAMQDLSSEDREAVLLRYFRKESFGAIGASLGASENAARMRVERALEKLRAALSRRGVTCPSSVLGGLLMANAVSSAPAGLAATLLMPAIASGAAATAGGATLKLVEIMTTMNVKTAVAVIALAGTSTGWIVAQRNAAGLEQTVTELRQRASETSATENSGVKPDDEGARLRAERNELMRLRAEVTDLRRQLRERLAATPVVATKSAAPMVQMTPEEHAKEELKMRGIARLNVGKAWGLAFYEFAHANNGMMPPSFQEAAQNFPQISEDLLKIMSPEGPGGPSGDGFEITFQGRIEDIANPAQAIIMREKEPFHFGPDGSALKTYLFADGHSEIHKAADGNFDRWEAMRQPMLKQSAAVEGGQ